MRTNATLLILGFCAAAFAQEKSDKPAGKPGDGNKPPAKAAVTADTATSPLDFTMTDIDGKEVPLSKYKAQVLLIVNVASKCGFTPQYAQLQQLSEKYGDRGLRIAAFPANNFGGQEPGSNGEIKTFCEKTYGVTFDMFSKISVKGDDQAELYKFLTSEKKDPGHAGQIQWNFTKFLVDRDGKVIGRFEPKVKPDASDVTEAIEKALGAKASAAGDKPAKSEPKKS